MKLILASKSPRRIELLKSLGYDFEVISYDVNEEIIKSNNEAEIVMNIAKGKAYPVYLDHQDSFVMGFDTLVFYNGKSFGKPKDEKDLRNMLKTLKNKTHKVITGAYFKSKDFEQSFYSEALVTFGDISDEEIDEYVKREEVYSIAGGYAIQGYAARFIKCVQGDYYTIVGLPLFDVYNILKREYKK